MWHLPQLTTQPAFIIVALDSVVFTGLFQLPGHMHPAQMPPSLGSLPWLNLLLLRMTLTFPYSPSGHCWKLGLMQLFLPWSTVGCLGPVLQQVSPPTSGLGGSRGSERRHDLPRVPQLRGTALEGTGTAAVFSTPNQPLEHSRTSWQ